MTTPHTTFTTGQVVKLRRAARHLNYAYPLAQPDTTGLVPGVEATDPHRRVLHTIHPDHGVDAATVALAWKVLGDLLSEATKRCDPAFWLALANDPHAPGAWEMANQYVLEAQAARRDIVQARTVVAGKAAELDPNATHSADAVLH